MRPSQTWMCPIPALLKHSQDYHQSSTKFQCVRHCCLQASPGLRLTIRRPGVEQSWKLNLSEKVQSSWSFANLSLPLLCFSLMKGFFYLCTTWALPIGACFEPSPQLPFAFAVSFYRSLDVIRQLLSDIGMSWWSSRSVESRFRLMPVCSFVVPNVCSLTLFLWTAVFQILRMEATWHSLSVKPELNPFFPSIKIFLFNSFGMV